MPILEGILIQTNDKEIKLTTYDLEIGIEYVMECEVKEQGSTVVNAIMFSEIIRKLPDTEIYITLNENNLLEIECEGALYKLTTMNPEEFPELPKIEVENSIDLEQNMLRNMIRRTIFAVSSEENRPIFFENRGCYAWMRSRLPCRGVVWGVEASAGESRFRGYTFRSVPAGRGVQSGWR